MNEQTKDFYMGIASIMATAILVPALFVVLGMMKIIRKIKEE